MIDILIGGDVYPAGAIHRAFLDGNAQEIFNDLLDDIAAADLSVINLECPLVSQETPIVKAGPVLGANRAIEGRTIEVDRLPVEAGNKFDIDRILLMADGDDGLVGTPTVKDILVMVTVVDHIKGPKIDRFKYRPKKRIRVRGGHRQHYTFLMVDFIGKPGEERKIEKPEPKKKAEVVEVAVEAEAAPKAKKQASAKKEATAKSTEKKSSTKKSSK